ncbi:hypothetical protein EVAR_24586_1 [Eumeta japonica]|uniref:Uncharacterized protein n=1 Tax=Eumeta variegata TaxID=151549 RepID=A0A4C1W6L6_EUMVA|nr:hypothetical protein EVAR_24586_1 [Eumeta japonica]
MAQNSSSHRNGHRVTRYGAIVKISAMRWWGHCSPRTLHLRRRIALAVLRLKKGIEGERLIRQRKQDKGSTRPPPPAPAAPEQAPSREPRPLGRKVMKLHLKYVINNFFSTLPSIPNVDSSGEEWARNSSGVGAAGAGAGRAGPASALGAPAGPGPFPRECSTKSAERMRRERFFFPFQPPRAYVMPCQVLADDMNSVYAGTFIRFQVASLRTLIPTDVFLCPRVIRKSGTAPDPWGSMPSKNCIETGRRAFKRFQESTALNVEGLKDRLLAGGRAAPRYLRPSGELILGFSLYDLPVTLASSIIRAGGVSGRGPAAGPMYGHNSDAPSLFPHYIIHRERRGECNS